MSGTGDDDSTGAQVYIPPTLWRDLLERLRAANLKCDAPSPADMAASGDALSAVNAFFGAIPAVRESGVIRPLQGLLAALPDLLLLANRFNQLLAELEEAKSNSSATTLEKAGTQLSMLVLCIEDATRGGIGAVLQPARELFEAVHDRVQGGRPALLWDSPSKRSRNRAHHITRAYLAAAVDWLSAANISEQAASEWWVRQAEYARAHKWRERIMNGEASELTIFEFEQLKPRPKEAVSEVAAKAKALELRKIAKDRKTDA
jgi:hypothetical protein